MNFNLSISAHARERMRLHGVAEEEIRLVLDTGAVALGHSGRRIATGVLTAGYTRRGRSYRHSKEVQVVYAIEEWSIVVVTVVARYGFWEGAK